MVFAVIVLGVAVAVLLFALGRKNWEIRDITRQLQNIPKNESNEMIHGQGSEKRLRDLIGEINSLLLELQKERTFYHRKNHELEQMMTNISHDLRTPLTSALGYLDILRKGDLTPEEQERELVVTEKRLRRMEELLDSFFEFSRVISGEEKPQKESLNLVGILEEAVGHYFDDFTGAGRAISLACEGKRIQVLSNRDMLLRIFDNLIANAFKHGGGDLKISVEESGGVRVRLENALQDAELEIDRVFDEFYTTDISRTKGHTGLGLAIAKQFARILDGEIEAEYDGEIFAVTVRLP